MRPETQRAVVADVLRLNQHRIARAISERADGAAIDNVAHEVVEALRREQRMLDIETAASTMVTEADRAEYRQLDRMFGVGQWVRHEGCPAALDADQPYAHHHKDFHGRTYRDGLGYRETP